jgi:hypothetical protein
MPSRTVTPSNIFSAASATLMALGAAVAFRWRRMTEMGKGS